VWLSCLCQGFSVLLRFSSAHIQYTNFPYLINTYHISQLEMGGGHKFEYPKWVWSPSGGWWPKPAAWKRNTVIYAVWMGAAAVYLASNAGPKTVAYYPKQAPASEEGDGHGHH